MTVYYNSILMPNEDLARLLICNIPVGKEFKSRMELVPYIKERWVELIKKSDLSFEKLEKEVYDWLQLENPFLDSERFQDLAAMILESPHYSEVLFRPEDILENDFEILDMETIKNIYEEETFGSLLQLLHEYF